MGKHIVETKYDPDDTWHKLPLETFMDRVDDGTLRYLLPYDGLME